MLYRILWFSVIHQKIIFFDLYVFDIVFLLRAMLLLLLSRFSHVQLCAPHWWQPTRLPHPWDSPGENIGVGCHFLLQCMKVKSESEVAQSCPTLSDPIDCGPPGSSMHGIFPGKSLGMGCHKYFLIILKLLYKIIFWL